MDALGKGGLFWWNFSPKGHRHRSRRKPKSSSSESINVQGRGWSLADFPLKQAAIAASLTLTGDTVAQCWNSVEEMEAAKKSIFFIVTILTISVMEPKLVSFPLQPYSPARILIVHGEGEDRVNPRLRQFIQESPPRIRGEWHLGPASGPEDPGLSEEEFKKAMKKIRKHIYNPPYPRRRAWKRGIFSRRSSNVSANEEDDEKDEEKRCTVCLETFVPNEQVMMTPCNHMFHNDCLVPWVKGQGNCPVCRYVLYERRETTLARNIGSNNNNYYGNAGYGGGDDDLAADFIRLLRAMEEALNWVIYSLPGSYR
ncbi:putative E3 ubiquitin-protein ligase RING1 [Cocos nucifera]|uniref:Putative E3 ubiquitin-protein ligase RING1 n=1 Tax=Cocos nucifera TaxID=13894 RepID=A0A8K0IUV8_COCNU|nr:putative E3 ubiquitin-protein ligase RING1 [Cocos nucifera]